MMVELEQLAKTFGGRVVGASSDVRSVTLDSRRVEPGALFCALAGSQSDDVFSFALQLRRAQGDSSGWRSLDAV